MEHKRAGSLLRHAHRAIDLPHLPQAAVGCAVGEHQPVNAEVAVMDGLVKIAAVGIHGPAVLPHANLNAVVAPFPYAAAHQPGFAVYQPPIVL